MASKKSAKNTLKEAVTLSYKLQRFVSYADFFNRVPLFISLPGFQSEFGNDRRYRRRDRKRFRAFIAVFETSGTFTFRKHGRDRDGGRSFAAVSDGDFRNHRAAVTIKALSGATVIVEECAEVTVLPFDYWSGRSGNAELLSCFSAQRSQTVCASFPRRRNS